jgi:uncharacterized protein
MEVTLLLGILVGAVLGLTGAGGGILAVPALVFGMDWSVQQAAPVALVAVAGSAAVGAIEGFRKRLVRYKAALVMALAGIPFTSIGVAIANNLPQKWLLGLFSLLLLLVAVRLLKQAKRREAEIEPHRIFAKIDMETGRFHWTWKTARLFIAIGAVTGFMTGLLGVGGGFVIVPALCRFTNVTLHGIVATSLMVIALVGTGGVVSAIAQGVQLPWPATGLFALATAIGMLLSRKLISHLSQKHVQISFAIVLVLVAVSLLWKVAIFG